MTALGSSDFASSDPARGGGWSHTERPVEDVLPPVVALPTTMDTRRVVIRVQGGEEIEVARAEGREPAVRIARDTIRAIEAAEAGEAWPEVGDRFIRPGAIVSVDVQRADGAG
jgi:hypothetical protein